MMQQICRILIRELFWGVIAGAVLYWSIDGILWCLGGTVSDVIGAWLGCRVLRWVYVLMLILTVLWIIERRRLFRRVQAMPLEDVLRNLPRNDVDKQ